MPQRRHPIARSTQAPPKTYLHRMAFAGASAIIPLDSELQGNGRQKTHDPAYNVTDSGESHLMSFAHCT